MRVLILCRRYIPGEAWTNRILAYARGFAEKGTEVQLCYLIGDKQRSHYDISIPGVKVINFWEKDGLLARRNRYVSLVVNLIKCKRYIQPTDCVFIYGADSYIVKIALKKTKFVYGEITEHPFKKGGDEKAKMSRSRFSLLNRLQGLFVISKSLKKYFVESGLREDLVHVSNMFVDVNRFERQKCGVCEKYFAYCGVVSKYKDGVDTLIKAFSLFHKDHQDYKLYIIGRFESEDVKKELLLLTEAHFVTDSVVFTGLVSPDKMPSLLCNAQALVLARPDNLQSKYGFPTKLGEYLATGNPVIITNVGEIGEFIKDRDNGIVLPPDDFNSFARGLAWVAEHLDEARKIGLRGKELALTEFSYKTQSEKVLDIMLRTSKSN